MGAPSTQTQSQWVTRPDPSIQLDTKAKVGPSDKLVGDELISQGASRASITDGVSSKSKFTLAQSFMYDLKDGATIQDYMKAIKWNAGCGWTGLVDEQIEKMRKLAKDTGVPLSKEQEEQIRVARKESRENGIARSMELLTGPEKLSPQEVANHIAKIRECAKELNRELSKEQLDQIAKAGSKAIDWYLDHSEMLAQKGKNWMDPKVVEKIRQCADKAGVTMTPEQLERLKGIEKQLGS